MEKLSVNQALLKANSLLKKGEHKLATQLCASILTGYPNNKRAQILLRRIKSEMKQESAGSKQKEKVYQLIKLYNLLEFQKVIERGNELVKSYPLSDIIWNLIGAANHALGKHDEAIFAFERVIDLNPENAEGLNNLGAVLQVRGDFDAAVNVIQRAVSLKPNYSQAFYNLGVAFKSQRKFDDALLAYDTAISLKPDYADAHRNLANVYFETGQLIEAFAAYKKALMLNALDYETLENLFSLELQVDIPSEVTGEKLVISKGSGLKRPKLLIYLAIKAYLRADLGAVEAHLREYNSLGAFEENSLSVNDEIFCAAYSFLLLKLTQFAFPKHEKSESDQVIYHLGESHCLSYAHQTLELGKTTYTITPKITFGAKAFHFAKNGNNQFKAITRSHLMNIPTGSKVFVSFGEIDCRPNEGFMRAVAQIEAKLENIIDDTVFGYLEWFHQQNSQKKHHITFLNVPAPVIEQDCSSEINSKVALIINVFNRSLERNVVKFGFKIIDVFKLTVDNDGFSNGLFHIDNYHLRPQTISEIEKQLWKY